MGGYLCISDQCSLAHLESGIIECFIRSNFRFLRIFNTYSHFGGGSLHSRHQWASWTLDSICCHLFLLILTILTGIKWNLKVVLICVSLVAEDIEYFFKCFSVIWVYWKFCLNLYPNFKIGSFGFLISSFLSSLYVLDINSVLDVDAVKNLSSFCRQPLTDNWRCPFPYGSFSVSWGSVY